MMHLRQLLKFYLWSVLSADYLRLTRMLLHASYLCLGCILVSSVAWGNSTEPNKISPEDAFLQGQQQLERADLAQAALSLSRITPNSPYAKLLAGNIAANNAEYERAFLLLVPLQSNLNFSKVATASLHASLSAAYEKQGDTVNALDQLVRRQSYINNAQASRDNQQRIWQLLSAQSLETLVSMRGESADTSNQGWVDLSLASKNQDISSSLSAWLNSYVDHEANAFATMLIAQTRPAMMQQLGLLPAQLLLPGSIALIAPLATGDLAEKLAAFHLGLQSALNQQNLLNEVKTYFSASNPQSAAEQYHQAKIDTAAYIIAPQLVPSSDQDSVAPADHLDAISIWDSSAVVHRSLRQIDLPLNDEAKQIAAFASSNSMQHILMIATDDAAARLMVKSFESVWPSGFGSTLKVITLKTAVNGNEASLDNASPRSDLKNFMDLRAKVNTHPHDILLLAMSAADAVMIRPYLEIGTPTAAFSSVHELDGDDSSHGALNAIRFVDMPYLLPTNSAQFNYYRKLSAHLTSNELLRCFALGVDYLQLLIAGTQATATELIINGLSGRLSIDSSGQILRQLVMAKFTYNAVIIENDTQN
jgi:outer membrane PBP1 activator LpoA protein